MTRPSLRKTLAGLLKSTSNGASAPEPATARASKSDEVLISTLIAMVRRAAAEMPGRVLREAFEADLQALLKEHGREG